MRRTRQECKGIAKWLETGNVCLQGVKIQDTKWGSGIVTTRVVSEDDQPLIQVPSKLVLSLKYVWKQAESDMHLRECLEALGEFTKMAVTSPDISERVGIDNPWTTYVQYIADEDGLPTFWSDEERLYYQDTSLEPAMEGKMKSLQREYDSLRSDLSVVSWCRKHWLDAETGCLTFRDWKIVDSMYRSRAMEIPSHGLCMVPIADMANHAHGRNVNARTDVNADTGDVYLVLDQYESVAAGEELTITYGEEKGACEMVFSYGFIDEDMIRTESIFLDLQDPGDDPIFLAKKHAFDCAPGVRISYKIRSEEIKETKWIGPFVWLLCVNQEDGLDFEVEAQDDGSRKLKAMWKGKELNGVVALDDAIRSDEMYDLFNLRGYVAVNDRIKSELTKRAELQRAMLRQEWWERRNVSSIAWKTSERLRKLEYDMLKQAEMHFNDMIRWLYTTKAVKRFFNGGEDTEDMWEWYRKGNDKA